MVFVCRANVELLKVVPLCLYPVQLKPDKTGSIRFSSVLFEILEFLMLYLRFLHRPFLLVIILAFICC